MNKIKFKLLVLIILFSNVIFAQNILISQGGTVNVSGGETFYDAGGASGNYNNSNYTITLCPANAGEKVVVDFSYFKTQFSSFEEDALFIYDGNSATGNDIGKLMGDYSVRTGNSATPYGVGRGNTNSADANNIFRPTIFAATNASGCLTFKFVKGSSASTSFAGWIGAISTYKDLGTPGCNITLTGGSICSGGSTTLTATGDLITSALNNNFNGSVGTGWVGSPAATIVSNVCSTPSLDGSQYLWMQNFAFPRSLESLAMDVSNGGTISFEYRQAKYNSDPSPCESPDILSSGTTNEGVFVQYSTDNGANWSTLKYLFSNSLNSNSGTADTYNNGCGDYVTRWTKMTYPIPNAAKTTSTKFRWIQPAGTSASTDNWGLDNVVVSAQKNKTITITNLTNGGVVGSSTSSPYTISVSPTTTTTYRATITDGVTSCFDDVTINVNTTPAATIAYPSLSVANTVTTAQNITLTNGPVTGNYTATPAGLTINATTGAVTPSTSTPGTYTISVPTACGTATTTLAITAAPCGSCASATCPIAGPYTNYTNATGAAHTSNCQTISPNIVGPNTYKSYYTVVASSSGNIGAIISNNNTPNTCSATRTAVLYATSTNCNGSISALIPVIGSNGSTFYNPEWSGLTPGATYIMEVTTVLVSGCQISDQCVSYYQPTTFAGCTTCATATCNVTSIIEPTAILGQTNISTSINNAGDILGLTPLTPGQSTTVCVPVTVVSNSILLGFKQKFEAAQGCGNTSEQVITYQLRPASNCSATPIPPNRTNASNVGSGFNPEWDNLAAGNYVLCFTLNVTAMSICNPVDLQGLGYYNIVPATVPCQDYQIKLYDDDTTSIAHTGTTFSCSDAGVYLGPTTDPTNYDSGLPFQNYDITITAITGNLNNLVLNRYDAGNNTLAERLTVTPGQVVQNYFLRPAPGQYYKLDKTNAQSGTYSYTIVDVISGATVASGTWTITAGAESAASITLIPQGSGSYSGPGVTNGFDPAGVDNYTNDRGIGFFNPSLAGPGTHTITYTWNNGLAAPNNCTLTRTKVVTVTAPTVDFAWQTITPTAANLTSCNNTCYGLKAKTFTQVGTYIQPGFTISDGNGNISYSSILIKEGTSAPISVGTQKIITYCVPAYAYVITLNGTDFATGSTVIVTDNATGTILFSGIFTSGMQISLPPNSIKGTAVFSGPGVSNVKVGQASDYIGSGYGCFNPSLAGVGTHTITYSWDNGFGCTGTKTMQVIVTGTSNPTVTNVSICSGSTATLTAGSISTGATVNWYSTATGGTTIFAGNPFTTPNLTSNTSYWVTQTIAGCESSRVKVDVTINPNVTPTFTQVAAICSGATLSALPTTSNNGITGTWLPALNNTATTTYTFTPDTGQCATTATMTITINPNVTPTFTQVAAICSGATLSALPTTSNNGITGTWLPALNNTATTTYTFTPDTGQCATTATMTIIVNPNVTPTFTQVAAICSGATLSALPTTSNNGITGTWLPALNNTATTTYTFTPDTGQCATTATMTITINPNVTPTFTQVAAICSGATLSALPTTSNNGITGTWLLALNNTATTTYTFTPDTGQCATTATMTITINPNVTPTFTQVAAICSGATLSALPTTSNNGITGTWLPALNNTATTTYTFTPDTGQCATTATMTITINPNVTPTFTQVAAVCSGATLSALPTTSNNGITGTWLPALNNTATTTYTFTPDTGQCATTATMTITINPNVTPTFTQVAAICSGATLSALPTTSNNGITGTWLPALNNTATTTYTFTPDTGQCATTATMTITINPNVTPTFTQVAAICSGATLSALPTTSNNGITGTWLPALNNTATTTYTFTPDTGQCATTATMTIIVNPNVTPTFTQVAAICSGATLSALPTTSNNGITGTWLPALNNTATTTYTFTPDTGQCATTATMTIIVNPNVTPTFTQVAAICSGATLSALPTTSNNGITGTWLPALNNTATTTYTFTPDTGQCGLNTTMTIVVHPLPTVIPSVTTQSFCSGGTTNINLTSNVAGATFSWTATATTITGQSGSVTGSGATSISQTLILNANQVAAGQVTYVIVAESNGCLGAPVTVVVTVNPIPNVIVSPASLAQTICSGQATNISFSGAINNTVYSWSVVSSVGVSGALNGNGTAINQILTTTGLSQGTVVYEVTPSLNGCTGTPQRITVTVNPVPEIFGSATHPDLCSGESTFISVSTFNATTVFNWTVDPIGVSGASAGTATGSSILIAQSLTTTGNAQGYVDYIITPVLTGCPGLPITVRVYVNPLPVVSLTDGTICVDAAGVPFQTYVLDSGLNDVNYDFVWTFEGNTIPGATNATYTATQVGTYTVVATNSTTNCVSNIASAVVTATNPATSLTVTQSEYFSDNAILTVNVTGGNGTLLYQLDEGALQESNVFTGVSAGLHIITVVDTQGCTYLTKEVLVIDYPKYFTPNGDGHNDTWNIIGLNQPDAKLYIFDRYGKLLKQLSATTASEGWNGIYNNEKLPSTDYWFTLDYTENGAQKQFKAHFSLIR